MIIQSFPPYELCQSVEMEILFIFHNFSFSVLKLFSLMSYTYLIRCVPLRAIFLLLFFSGSLLLVYTIDVAFCILIFLYLEILKRVFVWGSTKSLLNIESYYRNIDNLISLFSVYNHCILISCFMPDPRL